MHRVCAWCGKPYGDSDQDSKDSDLVTHGICEECERFLSAFEPGSLRRFLNIYSEPILCVDSDCRVLTANDTACDLLKQDRSTIDDLFFGEVALCRWALRDPGCGKHEHCLACTVRRTVDNTFATHTGAAQQPAYVERTLPDGTRQHTRLLLTSERRGELVLIQIDEMRAD